MQSPKKKTPQPRFSILAAIRLDQATRKGLDPASVPVRELEAEAQSYRAAHPMLPGIRNGGRS